MHNYNELLPISTAMRERQYLVNGFYEHPIILRTVKLGGLKSANEPL